jgi:hypothetical protein
MMLKARDVKRGEVTLTEFLLARIAEDEADARAADSSRWLAEDKGVTFEWRADDFHDGEAQARLTADTKANMWHISNWAPARVLAECRAKRLLLADLETFTKLRDDDAESTPLPQALTLAGIVTGLEHAALRLALPYADHPDYRQEWKL